MVEQVLAGFEELGGSAESFASEAVGSKQAIGAACQNHE